MYSVFLENVSEKFGSNGLNIEMEHSQIFEPVSTFVTPDKNLLKILGNNGENIWVAINFEELTICYTTSLLLLDLLL